MMQNVLGGSLSRCPLRVSCTGATPECIGALWGSAGLLVLKHVLHPLLITKCLRHVMRAILSVRSTCSHRCVSLRESASLKPVLILKHAIRISTVQTSMRTKWFKHIAIQIVQEHLLGTTSTRDQKTRTVSTGLINPEAIKATRATGAMN